jgi:heptosyltransferase-1
MKVLIVRLGPLADLVHALPVAAALRERYPDARIDWLVDARYAGLLDLVPVVDRRIVISPGGKAGEDRAAAGEVRYDGRAGVLRAIRDLRAERYDAAVDLQGLLKSAVLARLSGARRVIGFERRYLRERVAAPLYTERCDPGRPGHVVHKNLSVLPAFGVHGAPLAFPFSVGESPALAEVRALTGEASGFALINPGAAWPNKRWPPERFGETAGWLRDRHGLVSVVLWGPGEERLARAVAGTSSGAAMPAPTTQLADIISLSRAARLMISGDTGPLHLAAAAGTPIVALFGPTDPARNGPWAAGDISLSRYGQCVCHYRRRCRRERACIEEITQEDVRGAIDQRLALASPAA